MKYKKKRHRLGFYRVTPLPTEAELQKHYEEKYYQDCTSSTYSAKYTIEEKKYFENESLIAEHVWKKHRTKQKGSMMDIGCGEGFFMNYFVKKGWTVEGCDFSSAGMERNHPKLLKRFIGGDIFEIIDERSKKHTYDLINLSHVLEHVREPLVLLDKLKNLMGPKSLMRIRVPNDFSDFQELLLKKKFSKERWFAPPDHLSYFTFKSLKKVLEAKGYSVETLLASFPIETFIYNEYSNYALDRKKGKQAHKAQTEISNFFVTKGIDKYISYMEAAARLGFGRSITAFVTSSQ